MEHTGTGFLKKLREKCKNRKGVSLAETLFGFIIIVLMLSMLASTIIMTGKIKLQTDRMRKEHSEIMNAYWNYQATGGMENGVSRSSIPMELSASGSFGGVSLQGNLNCYEIFGSGSGIYEFMTSEKDEG